MNDFTILADSWKAFVEEAAATRAQWEATWAPRGIEKNAPTINYDERYFDIYDVLLAAVRRDLERAAPSWLTDPETWGNVAVEHADLASLIA